MITAALAYLAGFLSHGSDRGRGDSLSDWHSGNSTDRRRSSRRVQDLTRSAADTLSDSSRHTVDPARNVVRDHPLPGVLGAVLAGWVAGYFLRDRRI